jgi:hypothetical protein
MNRIVMLRLTWLVRTGFPPGAHLTRRTGFCGTDMSAEIIFEVIATIRRSYGSDCRPGSKAGTTEIIPAAL